MSHHNEPYWFRKVDGKYIPTHETPRFLSDGIWIVQTKPSVYSQQCIMKIGDISSVFPFADLAQHGDSLAEFLRLWEDSKNRYQPYGVYSLAIIKFISMTEEEKRNWIKILKQEIEEANKK